MNLHLYSLIKSYIDLPLATASSWLALLSSSTTSLANQLLETAPVAPSRNKKDL